MLGGLYTQIDPSDTIDATGDTADVTLDATNGEALVSRQLGRVTTPYREAEKFMAYLAAVLTQIQTAARAASEIPTFFDIDNAVGEQLTFLGKRLGFPRCHCVCDAQPVFGFACDDGSTPPGPPIVDFCSDEGVWRGCGGVSDLCLGEDEIYRAHLVARRYQMLGLFDIESLGTSLRAIWGSTAWVPEAKGGTVVIAPGRNLTAGEQTRLMVTLRALPIAPSIDIAIHYGARPIFGFGTGWADICSGDFLCPVVIDPYACGDVPAANIFGFEGLDTDPVTVEIGDPFGTWAECL
jgi:hypothetical protein